ncbi:MAG: 8-amino-7-oxononanoate synthase [Xanthobacteraceae bacterium]
MSSLDQFASDKLAQLDRAHLRRTLVETAREDGVWVTRGGRRLLSFCCNDYLNLTHHPAVKKAAVAAIQRYGAGSGASRLVTGNHPLFADLEARLARLKGTQAACVFGSGYLANTGIIPTFIGRDDLLLIDELAHACLWAGAQLTRGKVLQFRHNDVAHAEALLAEHRAQHPHAMIATDGVFSMDGDLAPLKELAELARRHDAWLISDDAHGIGVLGGGRGTSFHHGEKLDIPLQMGTLSKAIGGYGGYLCASQPAIDLIRNRARTLIYSTGLPPAAVAAAIAALDVIEREPHLAALPVAKAKAFTRRAGLPEAASTIVPVIVGGEERALAASRSLEEEGFLVVAIRPPTVAPGTARLRLTFCAAHPDDEIERLADIVRTRVLGN